VAKVETVEDKTASKAVVTEEKTAAEAKVPEPEAKPAPAPEEKEPEPVAKPTPAAKPAAPKPAVKPTPKPAVKAYDEDEAPGKPRISGRRQRVKIDGLTIVAIVAVIMALITLVWGFSTPEANEPLSMVDNTAIEVQSTPEAN
jgi:outer membrane biosynthesis protein TonB